MKSSFTTERKSVESSGDDVEQLADLVCGQLERMAESADKLAASSADQSVRDAAQELARRARASRAAVVLKLLGAGSRGGLVQQMH